MLERYRRYVVTALSIVFGILIERIFSMSNDGEILLEIILLILLSGALITYYILHLIEEMKMISYSVLLFILDADDRLLVVDNRYHKRLMLPCGNVPRGVTPGESALRFLKEQTSLSPEHVRTLRGDGLDARHLVPAAAQIEFVTKHEFSVQEHYAYIYFLRTDQKGEDRFCNLQELKAFGEKGLYSDLLQRYELLLRER